MVFISYINGLLKFFFRTYSLKFKYPFGVSGHTRSETHSVFLAIEYDGITGFGEACLPSYLGEGVKETLDFLARCRPLIEKFNPQNKLDALLDKIDALSTGCNAAKAGVDIAMHDLLAKYHNTTLARWRNIPVMKSRSTSFTIGIDNEEVIAKKIREATLYEVLKIKAGTSNDCALIETIRKYTSKPLYVDVNQGWKQKEYVLEMLQWMKTQNVLLLEQPMPKEMKTEMQWVTERSPIPTFADESVKRLRDLKDMAGAFSGVNIKLMKCTGPNEALKMIDYCRQHNLKVFLGCMAESSCGTAAMAQLMALADYIDLDAPELYVNDPFEGLRYKNGKIWLNNEPGLGVRWLGSPFDQVRPLQISS